MSTAKTQPTPIEEFDAKTASVASEIAGQVMPPGAEPGAGLPEGWTPEQVAGDFAAIFALLTIVRGEHWEVPEEKRRALGVTWCPIFQRYIPYSTDDSEVMLWLGAIGTLVAALQEPLKVEFRLRREKRKAASTSAGNTAAPESEAERSSAEKREAEKAREWNSP